MSSVPMLRKRKYSYLVTAINVFGKVTELLQTTRVNKRARTDGADDIVSQTTIAHEVYKTIGKSVYPIPCNSNDVSAIYNATTVEAAEGVPPLMYLIIESTDAEIIENSGHVRLLESMSVKDSKSSYHNSGYYQSDCDSDSTYDKSDVFPFPINVKPLPPGKMAYG